MSENKPAYLILKTSKDFKALSVASDVLTEEDCEEQIEKLTLDTDFQYLKVKVEYITKLKIEVERNVFTITERVLPHDLESQ